MDIISPLGYLKKVKKYWGSRRCQKLPINALRIKRKLKITRLGNKKKQQNDKKKVVVVVANKTRSIRLSPWKMMEKVHAIYVDAMWRLVGEEVRGNGRFKVQKKVLKDRATDPVLMMSEYRNDMVDSRMVMKIYKRILSFHHQSGKF